MCIRDSPLGVRLEPLGKTGLDEAREAFAEQIRALAKAGVDFLVIETMPALNEAHEALKAAEETAPELPVLVMVTVDDETNCLDGASPAQAAALLTEWGAGAIGVNCSTGPATVLTAIEAMRAATTLPLAALPNAGMPRAIEGRNIYLCSPEYMADVYKRQNIRFLTRTMTTAIALETSKGEFAFGLALGVILMSVSLAVNIFLTLAQESHSA